MTGWIRTTLQLLVCACVAGGIEIELDLGSAGDPVPSAILKGSQEAFGLNTRGIEMLERGELDAAKALFEEALVQFAGYTDADNNRGVVYFRKGTIFEARAIWEAIVRREPRYFIAWYNLGILSFHQNTFDKAAGYFENALRENRNFYEAMVMLSRIKLRQTDPRGAVDIMRKAWKINPDDQDVWSHYAFAMIQAKDTAGAIAILETRKDNAEALRMLGMLAVARGNHSGAAELLERAVAKGATADVLLALGSSLHENGKTRPALAAVEEYLKRTQNRAVVDAWILAGILAKDAGDMAAARRYFEQGRSYYPQDAILKYNLAQIYYRQKEFDSAEQLWLSLSDSLRDPGVYHLRALAATRKGDLVAAEKMIREAISLDVKAEYVDMLGVIQYRKGAVDSAAASFRKALALDGQLRSAQLNLALTGKTPGELKAALSAAQKDLSGCRDGCADRAFELSVLQHHAGDNRGALLTLKQLAEAEWDERILRHVAIYSRQLHEFDGAIEALEYARKKFVIDPKTEQELADVLLVAGYHARAIDVLMGLAEKWQGNRWRLYYQIGYAHMEMNALDLAKEYFERSLKAKGDNVAARGLLAFILNRTGDAARAQTLWEKNLQDDPSNPALLVNLGLAAEDKDNYALALDYYQKAAMLKGGDKALHVNIANAYTGLGQYMQALDAYSQALDSPKRLEAAYGAFLAATKAGRQEKARPMATILYREFRSHDLTRRAWNEVLLWDGDTTGAIKMLEEISEKDGYDVLALGRLYAFRRDIAKARMQLTRVPADSVFRRERIELEAHIAFAEGACDKALELLRGLKDTSFAVQYNIAVTAYACRQYATVLDMGQRLLHSARAAERADVCRLSGNAAFALKEWKKAMQWYGLLATFDPDDPIVQYNLAVAGYNLSDIETAWIHYTKARALNPSLRNEDIEKRRASQSEVAAAGSSSVVDTLDSLYNVAVDLQQLDSLDAAETIYRRIVAADKNYSLAWNNLGAVLVFREAYTEAEQCYRRALEKRYDLAETYANLISLYLAQGNFSEAKRWLVKGRGHNPESEILIEVEQMVQDSITAASRRKKQPAVKSTP